MQLQKQPDANCMAYAAAMVLGIPAEQLLAIVGHRGEKVAWPDLPGYHSRVGIHIQEIQDVYRVLGFALAEIQIAPCTVPRTGSAYPHILWPAARCEDRFKTWIKNREAILTGVMPNGVGHAVAWDGSSIYDPLGRVCDILETDLQIQSAWIKVSLNVSAKMI